VVISVPTPDESSGLAAVLDEAVEVLGVLDHRPASLLHLTELNARLRESRLQVAVLGQFKRGKSSFLNALLGAEVLPTAVLPLTSIPIFVRAGRQLAMQIHFHNAEPTENLVYSHADEMQKRLREIATEEGNPQNRLGIECIDIHHPSPVLTEGTILIDTPGIGSTYYHNTATAIEFLPYCDVGVVILSADPPVTEAEISFLKAVKVQVPHLVFVLNKVDYLTDTERVEVVQFLRSVLSEQLRIEPPPIHCLSARQALAAKRASDTDLMAESGLADIEERVIRPLVRAKAALLQSAILRKSQAALAEARMDLELAAGALSLPLDDLARRLATFSELLPQFERQRREAQDFLAGDKKRVLAELEDTAEQLRHRAADRLAETIDAAFASASDNPEAAAREALAQVIPVFFDTELSGLSATVGDRVGKIVKQHRQRASDLTETVRRTVTELFELSWRSSAREESFELERQPYWVTQRIVGTLIPVIDGPFDWLLPRPKRLARLRKRLLEDATQLVVRNVENLRWATLQTVEAMFRRFAAQLDEELAAALRATHGSISAAYEHRICEADRIGPQMKHILSATERLDDLIRQTDGLSNESSGKPMIQGDRI
jgi:GTP-binding protein EngB required for normal cell division